MKIIKNDCAAQKSQSVMEMMTTYSWAVLIISVFVALVFVLSGSGSGMSSLASSCTIQPLLPCLDTVLTNYTSSGIVYYVVFVNNLQGPIQFASSDPFNVITNGVGSPTQESSYGKCYPSFALVGDQVVCIATISGSVEPPVGTSVNILFDLSYGLCSNNQASSCSPAQYQTSSFATQSVAPAKLTLYYVLFDANEIKYNGATIGRNALLYINGVPYASSANIIFVGSGNYNLVAHPPLNFNFTAWSIISTKSKLSTSLTYNTMLTLSSNAIITATSSNVACNVCYPFTIVASACPSTCNTLTQYSNPTCTVSGSGYSIC